MDHLSRIRSPVDQRCDGLLVLLIRDPMDERSYGSAFERSGHCNNYYKSIKVHISLKWSFLLFLYN